MQMTARELTLYAEGYNKRERERWREELTIAHLTAQLVRCKRSDFPKLQKLLDQYAPERTIRDRQLSKERRIAATLWAFAGSPTLKKKAKKRNG